MAVISKISEKLFSPNLSSTKRLAHRSSKHEDHLGPRGGPETIMYISNHHIITDYPQNTIRYLQSKNAKFIGSSPSHGQIAYTTQKWYV